MLRNCKLGAMISLNSISKTMGRQVQVVQQTQWNRVLKELILLKMFRYGYKWNRGTITISAQAAQRKHTSGLQARKWSSCCRGFNINYSWLIITEDDDHYRRCFWEKKSKCYLWVPKHRRCRWRMSRGFYFLGAINSEFRTMIHSFKP